MILTPNKSELLKIFFTNPEKSFYMQEIGKMLGKKPGTFQRTLNNMVSEGLLTSEYQANAKFFKVNQEYPLYNEIKNIVFKTVGIQGSIQKVLNRFKNIRLAFIYGSYARNKEHHLSDIDLLIVGQLDESTLIREFDKLEKELKREINFQVYSQKAFEDGIKKNPFLKEILSDKKIIVMGSEDELQRLSKK